jgi:hypothetical protein
MAHGVRLASHSSLQGGDSRRLTDQLSPDT